MEIKLYNENDSRPNGSYSKIKDINILQTGVIIVNRDGPEGGTVITNMKFKVTIPNGEVVKTTYLEGCWKIEAIKEKS